MIERLDDIHLSVQSNAKNGNFQNIAVYGNSQKHCSTNCFELPLTAMFSTLLFSAIIQTLLFSAMFCSELIKTLPKTAILAVKLEYNLSQIFPMHLSIFSA